MFLLTSFIDDFPNDKLYLNEDGLMRLIKLYNGLTINKVFYRLIDQEKEIHFSVDDNLITHMSMDLNNDDTYKTLVHSKITSASNTSEIEDIILDEFRPYLRIEDRFYDKKYSPRYLNSEKVKEGQYYHFDKLFKTQNGQIIGIKWLKELYDNSSMIALMIDTNGEDAPNVWGKDLFGINIYKDKIEPFGKDISSDEVDMDCSKKGRGVYCSYKYLIGAQF